MTCFCKKITPPPPPPQKKKALFFFLGGGGWFFLEYFHEFLGLGHKKNFGKTLGQSRCFGIIIGQFRPLPAIFVIWGNSKKCFFWQNILPKLRCFCFSKRIVNPNPLPELTVWLLASRCSEKQNDCYYRLIWLKKNVKHRSPCCVKPGENDI